METTAEREFVKPEGLSPLWYSILIGPLMWALDDGIAYALVPHACSTGHTYPLHLVFIITLLITLSGAVVALRCLGQIPSDATMEGGAGRDRARFMAVAGLVLSVSFAVVIIAQEIPRFILSPCDQ